MIEQRIAKNGMIYPTFVPPPEAVETGAYPTKVLGCKLKPKGLAAQK